jgi:hypothetical protein
VFAKKKKRKGDARKKAGAGAAPGAEETGPQAAVPEPAAGDRLGRYTIERPLGHGGMGTVYLAHDPVIGRQVAIKVITARPETEEEARQYRERFLREAQAAGSLDHPNIIAVHDIGLDPASGRPYIVMEYVEGPDLKRVLRERAPLPPREAIRIAMQIASALDFAHGRGIVHRDIKPANVLLGDTGQVKITDFGVARLPDSDLTQTDQMVGSPGFMSPEQLRGAAVDGRSDLFALGVILYLLLTGKSPFEGESVSEVLYRISTQPAEPPSEAQGDVSPDFDPILERALGKEPEARYQSGREMIEALRAAAASLPGGPEAEAGAGADTPAVSAPAAPAPAAGGSPTPPGDQTPGVVRRRPAAGRGSAWWNLNDQWRLAALVAALLVTFVGVNWAIHALVRGPLGRLAAADADGAPPIVPLGGGRSLAVLGGTLPVPARGQARGSIRPGRVGMETAGGSIRLDPASADGPIVPVCAMTHADPTEVARVLLASRRLRQAASTTALPAAGRVRLEFSHHLSTGRVIVLVDGKTVLSKPFDLPKGKKSGDLTHLLSVPAGRHGIEVRVLGEKGEVEAKSKIAGTVGHVGTAILRVEERGGPRKPLRLEWDGNDEGRRPRS